MSTGVFGSHSVLSELIKALFARIDSEQENKQLEVVRLLCETELGKFVDDHYNHTYDQYLQAKLRLAREKILDHPEREWRLFLHLYFHGWFDAFNRFDFSLRTLPQYRDDDE